MKKFFAAGCLLFWAAGVLSGADASSNLLPDGDFQKVKPGAVPSGWSLKTDSGNRNKWALWACREQDGIPGKVLSLAIVKPPLKEKDAIRFSSLAVPAEPLAAYELTLKYRLTMPPAEMKEHSCSPGIIFLDSNKKWLAYKKLPLLGCRIRGVDRIVPKGEGFLDYKAQFQSPAGTGAVALRFDLWGAGSKLEIADIRLVKCSRISDVDVLHQAEKALPEPPKSGETVKFRHLTFTVDWTNPGADTVKSRIREQVTLDNLWGFRIADSSKAGWDYIRLPDKIMGMHSPAILYHTEKNKFNLQQTGGRWLYRTVDVPLKKDGRYFLKFDLLQRCGVNVFWNGKALGILNIEWGGVLEIPASEVKEKGNQLLVYALPRGHNNSNDYLYDAGLGTADYKPVNPWEACAVGHIDLLAVGKSALFDSVRINSSWRRKQLTVSFLNDAAQKNLHYTVSVRDQSGKELLKAENLTAKAAGKRLEVSMPWANPPEWTPDTPNLLYLTIAAYDENNRLADESLPTRFGFREVWCEGKKMFLNGKELRLHPRLLSSSRLYPDTRIRRIISVMKDMGFNTIFRFNGLMHYCGEYSGSTPIRVADEMGMMVLPPLPVGKIVSSPVRDSMWQMDSANMKFVEKTLIDRYFNNPSVIGYTGPMIGLMPFEPRGGVLYSNAPVKWGIDPVNTLKKLDEYTGKYDFDRKKAHAIQCCMRFVGNVKKLDPARLWLTQTDIGSGDGWGAFTYFNFMPVQEESEWLWNYRKHGSMPIGSSEHGLPYAMSFVGHNGTIDDGEPYLTEYAADVIGEDAYDLSTPDYRNRVLKGMYRPKRKSWGNGQKHPAANYFKTIRFDGLMAVRNKPIYRAWRLAGMSMGIEPFGGTYNFLDVQVGNPLNGKIGIVPGEKMKTRDCKEDFIRVERGIVDDIVIHPTKPTGKIPAGANRLGKMLFENNNVFLGYLAGRHENPFEQIHIFKTGETVEKQIALIYDGFRPLAGKAVASVTVNGEKIASFQHDFSFASAGTKLIPLSFKVQKAGKGTVTLNFTGGKAGRTLGTDTFSFDVLAPVKPDVRGVVLYNPAKTETGLESLAEKTVSSADFRNAEIVMVAPDAMTFDLWKKLPSGMPVMVMAQDWKKLEEFGFAAHPIRARRVYPDNSFAIPENLLRDWRAGKPVELDGDFTPEKRGYINKVSSTGMVARTLIETPTAGNFTPLAHGGFDLAYTPLLKADIDGHPVIFCQLEIGANANVEPAVPLIMNELYRILKAKQPVLTGPAVLGSTVPLKAVGADRIRNGLPDKGTVLVEKCTDIPALKRFVQGGGTAVVLPQTDAFYRAFGIAAKRERNYLYQAKIPGLNRGNYHSRVEIDMVMVDGSAIAEKKSGKGRLVLVGFNPETINVEKTPWLRYTKHRQHRALAQILTNCRMKLEIPAKSIVRHWEFPPYSYDMVDHQADVFLRKTVAGEPFFQPDLQTASWKKIVPQYMMQSGFPDAQIRWEFNLTREEAARQNLKLDAGTFDDYDETYLNGEKIGFTTMENGGEKAYAVRRLYPVRNGLLKEGRNVLAIRFWNRNGLTKGWQSWLRGPVRLFRPMDYPSLYADPFRAKDEPYILYQW